MFKINWLFIFCVFITLNGMTQNERFARMSEIKPFPWKNGKRCAVSLTFDDARRSQVDVGTALLNKYGIKASFYVIPRAVNQRLEKWKQAVVDGHEIGNHTVSHPCSGNLAFSRRNALENFTLQQIEDELDQANQTVLELLGVPVISFAYPCGNSFVGRGTEVKSYVPLIAKKFISGRGWLGEDSNDPWFCDMAQLQGVESDRKTYQQLLEWVQKAEREGRWLVLAGHEIGHEGNQTTLIPALEKIFEYVNNTENGIWVDTVGNIAEYVISVRENESDTQ